MHPHVWSFFPPFLCVCVCARVFCKQLLRSCWQGPRGPGAPTPSSLHPAPPYWQIGSVCGINAHRRRFSPRRRWRWTGGRLADGQAGGRAARRDSRVVRGAKVVRVFGWGGWCLALGPKLAPTPPPPPSSPPFFYRSPPWLFFVFLFCFVFLFFVIRLVPFTGAVALISGPNFFCFVVFFF